MPDPATQPTLSTNALFLRSNVVLYYLSIRARLVEIYKSVNHGSLEWTPECWGKFVNSHDLYQLVHEKIATLSGDTQRMFAACEGENILETIILPGGIELFSMPTEIQPRSDLVVQLEGPSRGPAADAWGPIGIGQSATRQFTKVLVQMFLRDVLKVEFRIRSSLAGDLVEFDTDLNYRQADN